MTDHAAEAFVLIRESDPALAQVHATLALVEEQRTANLLALYGLGGPDEALPGLDYESLAPVLLARLGLTPATPNQEQ